MYCIECLRFDINFSPIISPWNKDVVQFESQSLKNALCQVCLKLVQRFWERRFLNVCIQFFLLLSPLRTGFGPSFEQIYITISQGSFLPSLVEIGPVVLWKKILNHQCNFLCCYHLPLV